MNHRKSRVNSVLPATLALVIVYAVIACSTPARRTQAEQIADAALAAQVQAALLADPNIYARHIDVAVDRGVVVLGGYVWTNQEFVLARNDAAAIPGVKAVDTNMELMRGGVSGTSR
jgi:osmotically-inducible protein OsmY